MENNISALRIATKHNTIITCTKHMIIIVHRLACSCTYVYIYTSLKEYLHKILVCVICIYVKSLSIQLACICELHVAGSASARRRIGRFQRTGCQFNASAQVFFVTVGYFSGRRPPHKQAIDYIKDLNLGVKKFQRSHKSSKRSFQKTQ